MQLSQLTNAGCDVSVAGLTADSRQVRPGYLFAALPGSKVDGGDYISDALMHDDLGRITWLGVALSTFAPLLLLVPGLADKVMKAVYQRLAKHDPSGSGQTFLPPDVRGKTGVIRGWTEDAFVTRMRAGRSLQGSPMPWNRLAEAPEDDLRALYRYLSTL